MYYEQLRNEIKNGNIASLYIFEGQEQYLIEFCIEEIKKRLIEPWAEMLNFKSYAFLPEIGEATDFIETLPVMSERKMVVFRRCGMFGNIKNRAQWQKLLCELSPEVCVIIWDEEQKKPTAFRKEIGNAAVTVSFPLQSEGSLRTWITKIAAASQKNIAPAEAVYLAASLGRKMQPIRTELEKIIAFSKSSDITREDIDSVIVKPADESVFSLIDAIFDGKREQCYKLIYSLCARRQEPVAIISLFAGQLITMYRAKLHLLSGKTAQQTVREIGGGYAAEKCVRRAVKIKAENIEHLINLCYEKDRDIKQGIISGRTALEALVAEYKFY